MHKLLKLIILIIILTIPVVFLNAQTVEDVQNMINQKDSDIAQLEKEIALYQGEIDGLVEQKNSLNSSSEYSPRQEICDLGIMSMCPSIIGWPSHTTKKYSVSSRKLANA